MVLAVLIKLAGNPLDFECGLKSAQIHGRSFSSPKNPVQPLAALDSFLPNGKKMISRHLSSMGAWLVVAETQP